MSGWAADRPEPADSAAARALYRALLWPWCLCVSPRVGRCDAPPGRGDSV